MKRSALLYILLFLTSSLSGCNNNINKNWKPGIIEKYGEYHVVGNGYIIKISEQRGLLDYNIIDSSGRVILSHSTIIHPSVYQSWVAYFDERRNFWIESADVGTMVWKYIEKDRYIEVDPTKDSSILKQEPEAIKRAR